MKKLYVVRHFVEASSIKEAIRLTQNRQPEDIYLSDEWMNKVGFLQQENRDVKGF